MPKNHISAKSKFAFLVHPRELEDFLNKYPFLRFLPKKVLYFLTLNMPPVIVSNITGLKDKNGMEIGGYVIAITMTARQMTEHRERALRKMKKALFLAEKKGVRLMGLGALTASFSGGGTRLAGLNKVGITTGRAYTVKTVTDYAKKVINEFGLDRDTATVAVVGAAGSIGSSSAEVLAEFGMRNFILIDLERKADKVRERIERIKKIQRKHKILLSHHIGDVKTADIVVTATSAPEVLIKPDDLKSGAIIINDAQPSDIDSGVLDREDVLVIEGGVINTPGIKTNFPMGLAGREDNFSCLGEVLILAHHGLFGDYSLGEPDKKLINDIGSLSLSMKFNLSKIQNANGIIDNNKINRVREIIVNKKHKWI